ncbi:MAG: aminotransferase class V-fold PLP-dependent enzyme [Candidatus Bathyarchaeota archaeon]|nr:MAG: aminotransferase class V-fold PLP-dependent enzyme [Candidatus Bathyarchaeota archaeon]
MRALGHQMVDDMMTYLETLRERPVWQRIPEKVRRNLKRPLPMNPQGAKSAYQDFIKNVLPHPMGNIHPRFWGWVEGTGTPLCMLAEMLAAGMNPDLGAGDHVANYVEAHVLDWLKEMLGYPVEASGLLVSGGSTANLTGLTVARNTMAEFDVRQHGLQASRKMILYASRETHSSLQKAVELLGLGNDALRKIPVNAEFQMETEALETAISEDRSEGYQPIVVIGNAGTVNTGAFDNLNALADICAREELWFHVDAAFGAWAALSPKLRHLVSGMERADSLAFDLHKWMYMPFELGCALVRRKKDQLRAFALTPDYLARAKGGISGGPVWYSEYGFQCSRGFRALKAWMSLKEHGVLKYGRLVQQNVEQARYLAELVDTAPELERVAPVPLNIVCFRFTANGLDKAALNELNSEILVQLQESGVAVLSSTMIKGKYALRVAITNHRSRREDFELLVREVTRLGNILVKS